MPRTIQCPDCGVVLNVPEAAVGRRVKCPKCGNKFAAEGPPTPPSHRSPTSPGASGEFHRASSISLPTTGGHGDLDLPTASGSLREQFDLPLLGEDLPVSRGPASPAAAADPMALFKDDPPVTRRKPLPGDARSKARRCPTCGSVVPQGMSLCGTCGLDLDTGTRVDLVEDIETVAGPRRSSGPPIGVIVVGGLSIAVAVIFGIISLLQWQKGDNGYVFLLMVCLFGIYAAIQFLRSRTTRLLLVALTLGAMVDVVVMMILPVYYASIQVDIREQAPDPNAVDAEAIAIGNISDRLDTNKLSWGIAILVCYAAVSVYLNSPPVKRYFRT